MPWALAPVTLVFIGRSLDGTEQERGGKWQGLCGEASVHELISQSFPEESKPFAQDGEDAWIGGKSIGNYRERKHLITNMYFGLGCALGT